MNILLITPPLTQLNTPYPATSVLKAYLQSQNHQVQQFDLGIALINKVYARQSLAALNLPLVYQDTVDAAIGFLQGDRSLAIRIANGNLLPEGPRFNHQADLDWAYGVAGLEDRAKHLTSLYLEDIADLIRKDVAPHFDLIRYAEQISLFAPHFDELQNSLNTPNNSIDTWMLELLESKIQENPTQLIGLSIPFPGCLYGGLKCAQYIKSHYPDTRIVMGGGYINTELRSITDTRIFQYIDYMTLDDGELPLLRLVDYLEGRIPVNDLVRTYFMHPVHQELMYSGNDGLQVPFNSLPTPDFTGLDFDQYLSLVELTNPMHKLWTDGKWNKFTLAHGCYWAQCAFCDTHLDYIKRYEAPKAPQVVSKMKEIVHNTKQTGFHFTDEALPPKLLRELSTELLAQKLVYSYWGNIRFEKAFTPDLCQLMAQAGCIAVSGGLEVASDRLLKLMNKGVSITQAAQSCRNFTESGIMVHAYLMYNFPTETFQETIDSLEVVRQLFEQGLIQSAFWHRYAMTIHSPMGKDPEKYGVKRLDATPNLFANNEVPYTDQLDYDPQIVGRGLYKATYNYMHGLGLDLPLHEWFEMKIPKTRHKKALF